MSDKKQPQPGEWWRQRNGNIAYVAGRRPECDDTNWPLVVVDTYGVCREPHTEDGCLDEPHIPCAEDLVEHLPECTGWDWVPETWPKWYVRTSGADSWVYRADDKFTIHNLTTGLIASPADWYWRHGNMVEITEAEALARVTPPAPATTKIPLRVFVSKDVAKGEWWPPLFVSVDDTPLEGTNYIEVHGLQIYIEDPSASGSVDDTE